MTLVRFAVRSIAGSSFRSWVVALSALLLAGLALSTVLIVRGAQDSLRLAAERLGADILVVPADSVSKIESALLMGAPTTAAMPRAYLGKIRAVPGVAQVSPQLYLSSLKNASCCSVSDMFLVAYEPETDFTLRPWLTQNLDGTLRLGQAVGGTYIFTPEGEHNIKLYGYHVTLVGNLEPTGTNLDQSLFFTVETAEDVARISLTQAEKPLQIKPDTISAALVKVTPGVDAHAVAARILQDNPELTPIESLDLFSGYRTQIAGLLSAMLALLGITTVLSLVLIGLVFLMAANERRREMGVLRAMGAPRSFVFAALLAEAGLLAAAGALPGLLLAAFTVYLFRTLIIRTLGVPFLFPGLPALLIMVVGGLVIVLLGVCLAAFFPAFHISRQEPAVAMRE